MGWVGWCPFWAGSGVEIVRDDCCGVIDGDGIYTGLGRGGVGWVGGHSQWAGCNSPIWDIGLLVKGSVTVPGLIPGWMKGCPNGL